MEGQKIEIRFLTLNKGVVKESIQIITVARNFEIFFNNIRKLSYVMYKYYLKNKRGSGY